MNQHTSLFDFKSLPASLRAALVGALGGFLAFWLSEMIVNPDIAPDSGFGVAIWAAMCSIGMGPLILAYDNAHSLRGRWYRDLLPSLPCFALLGGAGSMIADMVYAGTQNSLTRGLAWAVFGMGLGLGIGVVRRDMKQALRGALGGACGGFIGGLIFDSLALFSEAFGGAVSRCSGLVIMGAMIAFLIRIAQDTLRGAWLAGLTPGYEGKEYPLNKARVTVGRSDDNDIALYRGSEINMQSGAFVFTDGQWRWQGESIAINGVPQDQSLLQPGDVIQLGAARFLFQTRAIAGTGPQLAGVPVRAPLGTAAPTMPQGFAPQGMMPRTLADLQPWNGPNATPDAAAMTWLLAGSQNSIVLPPAPASLSVGRGEMNEIVLPDIAVSTRHARLEVADDALHVIDLGSTNGTYINGQRLSPQIAARLKPNDQLRLGQLEYTIQVSHHG